MIRKATINDLNTIVDFNAFMAKETENIELDRTRLQIGVKSILQDSTKGIYYVYELDNQVVGQIMITYEWSDWRNGFFWWIQSVYVDKLHRRKGIFQSLYNHIKTLAENDPTVCGIRLYVEKENYIAQTTYKKLGLNESCYLLYEYKK